MARQCGSRPGPPTGPHACGSTPEVGSHRPRRLAVTYGHAERNLAFIRQLEAETRQLRVRSAVGPVLPFDTQSQGDDEVAPVFSQAVPDLDRDGRDDGRSAARNSSEGRTRSV